MNPLILLLIACSSDPALAPPPTPVTVPETPAVVPATPPETPTAPVPEPPSEPGTGPATAAEPEPRTTEPTPNPGSEHQEQKVAVEAAAEPAPEPERDPEAETDAATDTEAATPEPPAASPEPEPEPEAAGPVQYTVDSSSRLVVLVYKDPDTMGAGLSHDHVVQAKGFTGRVIWDEADPGACQVSFSVPVSQLDVDYPANRVRYGLEGGLSESQRADVRKNMLAKDQLDSARYPKITFESTGCDGTVGLVKVQGTLTIHGTGKAVTAPMTVAIDGDTFTASGSFGARHSDFGMAPFTAMFGQLKNKDPLSFQLNVTATAR